MRKLKDKGRENIVIHNGSPIVLVAMGYIHSLSINLGSFTMIECLYDMIQGLIINN